MTQRRSGTTPRVTARKRSGVFHPGAVTLIAEMMAVWRLATTSHLDAQAYREIREDDHPIVVLAGRDVIDRLKAKDWTTL